MRSCELRAAILLDAHVHLHTAEDLPQLLDAAHANLLAQACQLGVTKQWFGVLMLAEARGKDRFRQLCSQSHVAHWCVRRIQEEDLSLQIERQDGASLLIIAGRQVVTAERVELLALACSQRIEDGSALESTIDRARSAQSIVVLPWGFGKWNGRRGGLVSRAFDAAPARTVFLGDNGGRPTFAAEPKLFRMSRQKRIPLISGTDPLPIPGEHLRVGRRGCCVFAPFSKDRPAASIRSALQSSDAEVKQFGQGLALPNFVRNQFALRLDARARETA